MSDEQAITETLWRWLKASGEGDLRTLADILDDDVLFTVVGRPPFGKSEFLANGSGKPHLFDADLSVLEIVVNRDWALTRVELRIGFAPNEHAKIVRLAGPAVSVWRKAGDRWKIWRDANMVAPAP